MSKIFANDADLVANDYRKRKWRSFTMFFSFLCVPEINNESD